ncbi:MAG: type II toxin-antitoxin system RelE/ParE family toxin [Alphaproteobacteria bacterium]|nr:type II toxin-antitoxin system RelE/ParE family toxin [Alphaproteobacteria bacterium]
MPHAFFLPAAKRDLFQIADFIEQENPGRGLSFADEIEAACQLWATIPQAGRERGDIAEGLRSFPHGSYIVFYRAGETGITIVRILHGMRDLKPLL